jgi:hypothetical protein
MSDPVVYGPGYEWAGPANMFCDGIGEWALAIVPRDFPFGGVLPCNLCHGIHQVVMAEQENARPPLPAGQLPGCSIQQTADGVPVVRAHPEVEVVEMGIWCEACLRWTPFGPEVLIGQLFTCPFCRRHCQADRRVGDNFERARGLEDRYWEDGEMKTKVGGFYTLAEKLAFEEEMRLDAEEDEAEEEKLGETATAGNDDEEGNLQL